MWSALVQGAIRAAAAAEIISHVFLLRPGVGSSEKGLNEPEPDMIILPPPELYADLTEA